MKPRLRAKLPALREALDGRIEATHRFLLRHLLDQIDFLQGEVDRLSAEVDPLLGAYEGHLARLMRKRPVTTAVT